jgi:hypothetical protein
MNLKQSEIRSAIIGMVIGDGCLSLRERRNNAYFQCSHSEKQKEYIEWKQKLLGNIVGSSICPTTRNLNGKIFTGYHLSTKQHPLFTQLYNRFYHKHHKVLDEYIVKQIDELAFAIMYMDDGCFGKHHANGKDSFFLCTQSFDYANQILLCKSLKIKFGLDWNINKAEKSKDGTYNYRLRLANRQNEEFLKIIIPYVNLLNCMKYKLGSDANTSII